jgi:CSLREA domain-containing protein
MIKKWLLATIVLLNLFGFRAGAFSAPQVPGALVVNSLTDAFDDQGCTLRAAVRAANTNTAVQGCPPGLPGHDVITFSVNGVILLTQPGIDDYGLVGDLDILEPLTIRGNGVGDTVVDANGIDRVFDIHPTGFPAEQSVTLEKLTIQGGQTDGFGGGVRHNSGSLVLRRVVVTNNQAATGGGLAALAEVYIRDSAVSHNQAGFGGGVAQLAPDTELTVWSSVVNDNSAAVEGGGLLIEAGQATLVNSSIALNHAAFGSGVMNKGDVTAVHLTIAANGRLTNSGDGLQNGAGATILLWHNILDRNLPQNCGGDWTQATAPGPNLTHDNSCPSFSLSDTDPLLGALQNNGGPTVSMMPQAGSPALGVGNPTFCAEVATDQRGYNRLYGGGPCDLGAVERDGVLLTYLSVVTNP